MSEDALVVTLDAIMDISSAAYEEIKARFQAVGADEMLGIMDGREIIQFGTVGFRKENPDDHIKVYLVYDGKVIKPKGDKNERTTDTIYTPDGAVPGPDGDSTDRFNDDGGKPEPPIDGFGN